MFLRIDVKFYQEIESGILELKKKNSIKEKLVTNYANLREIEK